MNILNTVLINVRDDKNNLHEISAHPLRHKWPDLFWHLSLKVELYKEYTITELTTGLAIVKAPSLVHAIQALNNINQKSYFASLQKRRLQIIQNKQKG